jgi:hypothetical protein
MDEIKFVLKCFVFACLVFALSQYQTENGQTVEAHVHGYLVSSSVAKFVNETARGGVKLAKNISQEVSQYLGLKKEEVQIKPRPIHSAKIRKTEKTYIDHDTIEEDFDQRLQEIHAKNKKVDILDDVDLE